MKVDYSEVISLINEESSFYIVSHYLPDGDSVGSALALALSLIQNGKNVNVYCRDSVPVKYKFLDKGKVISTNYPEPDKESILLVLDCSDFSRTGISEKTKTIFKKIVNIDHHVTNDYFADVNLVDPDASATGEIIFEIINRAGFSMNDDIANSLYVSISTDTGSFKYENTTSKTHKIVAELLEYAVNSSVISQLVFDEKPLSYFLILKKALSTLELFEKGKIASITLNNETLMQEGADIEVIDGIVNYAKNIADVEVGIIFYIAGENEIKVGLRSKNADVSEIAGKFNGGGHVRAAGFRAKGNYPEIKEKTIKSAIRLISNM